MIDSVHVSVVVPAFREAERIGGVLSGIHADVDRVIVVDDGSDDRTAAVARAHGDPRVFVASLAQNRGVGAAIATGYRHALGEAGDPRDAFVVMAGDGQMDPNDVPALVRPIARGVAGYVKGNRFGHREAIPLERYLGGVVLSSMTRAALGIDVNDSQCGFTAISREACATLDLDGLWPRFGYPNDLLSQLAARNVTIHEVPVRPLYPHRTNKMGARHVPLIAAVIARAWLRRIGSRG